MYTGSCLCKAVEYRIDGAIDSLVHCHCSMCRKAHGAAFGSYAQVPLERFHLTRGKDQLGVYHSSAHCTRTFCSHCGATLQFVDNRRHDLGVAAGTLDTPLGEVPQAHIFVDSKADWVEICDRWPQHRLDSE